MSSKIEYVEIPYVKKKVSRIIYGTAIPPFMTGEGRDDLLDAVYSMGVNTFDLARVYQLAETSVGRWIDARGIREDLVLLSKLSLIHI